MEFTRKPDQGDSKNDINEIFADILLSEEHLIKDSYEKGYEIGSEKENLEAFHLGFHRGAELGSEIGYIASVVNIYSHYFQTNNSASQKITDILNSLKDLTSSFPKENSATVDLLELTTTIRGKFKKLCALLKITCTFFNNNQLTF